MKTFLIALLAAALLAAAFFTRPTEQHFRDHLARARTPKGASESRRAIAVFEADDYARRCTFRDCLLWVDVRRDGQTVYTGAFAHWFDHNTADKTEVGSKGGRARR
jgi:hypothetical protein